MLTGYLPRRDGRSGIFCANNQKLRLLGSFSHLLRVGPDAPRGALVDDPRRCLMRHLIGLISTHAFSAVFAVHFKNRAFQIYTSFSSYADLLVGE